MTTPNVPSASIGLPVLQGFRLTFVAGGLTLGVAAGKANDSTGTNEIVLPAAVVFNSAVNGVVNGLDAGAFAASRLYAVYVIADSTGYNAAGSLLSLNATQPLLPAGYDMYRRVGTVRTSAGSIILDFTQKGDGLDREMWYADAIATPIAAGASAAFAIVNLTTAFLAPVSVGDVMYLAVLTADAGATRTAALRATSSGSVAGQVLMSSPASTVTTTTMKCPASNAAGVVSSDYLVSNAAAAIALSVHGYVDQL